MNSRTAGILTTSIAAIICGCPGILILCVGAALAFSSLIPGVQVELPSENPPRSAIAFGLGAFCLGMILIAIPIIVGLLALRNRPEMVVATDEELIPGVSAGTLPPEQPLPPAG